MKRNLMKYILIFAALLFVPSFAQAQAAVTSNTAAVNITYTQAESLSVSVTPSSLALTTTPQPLSVVTTWNLKSTRTHVGAIGTFSSATAALQGTIGANVISTLEIIGQGQGSAGNCQQDWTGNTTMNGLFDNVGVPLATCPYVFDNAITGGSGTFTQAYQLSLQSGYVPVPDTYSGTFSITAYAL